MGAGQNRKILTLADLLTHLLQALASFVVRLLRRDSKQDVAGVSLSYQRLLGRSWSRLSTTAPDFQQFDDMEPTRAADQVAGLTGLQPEDHVGEQGCLLYTSRCV